VQNKIRSSASAVQGIVEALRDEEAGTHGIITAAMSKQYYVTQNLVGRRASERDLFERENYNVPDTSYSFIQARRIPL
jgi:hypothetical protein